MNITVIPKETLAELLLFLAENESFESVEKLLGAEVNVTEIRAAFREIADELKKEVAQEVGKLGAEIKKELRVSRQTRQILSYLSPGEEKTLFQALGILEKP